MAVSSAANSETLLCREIARPDRLLFAGIVEELPDRNGAALRVVFRMIRRRLYAGARGLAVVPNDI
jgi:hypothetical protein